MDASTNHHYRPPFGKQQQQQQQPQAAQESLSFRTARDQLEIDEARTKTNGGVIKKSLGMHSSAKYVESILFQKTERIYILDNRRSIYTRYVDPTAGRQIQTDSNQQLMPPSQPVLQADSNRQVMPSSQPVLQTNQTNNTEPSNNKLEESGGAKHIDAKLIEMITSEVTNGIKILLCFSLMISSKLINIDEPSNFFHILYRLWNLI